MLEDKKIRVQKKKKILLLSCVGFCWSISINFFQSTSVMACFEVYIKDPEFYEIAD